MKLSPRNMRVFRRAQRKYNVSIKALKANMASIRRFLCYAVSPHIVIRHQAVRRRSQRVVLDYFHLQRFLFDPARRALVRRRKRHVQQWSRQMVLHLRHTVGTQEYVEEEGVEPSAAPQEAASSVAMAPEEVSKQLKEQLELLRSGKRTTTLIEGLTAATDAQEETEEGEEEKEDESANHKNPVESSVVEDESESHTSVREGEENAANSNSQPVEDLTEGADPPLTEFEHVDANASNQTFDKTEEESMQNCLEKTPEKQIVAGQTNGFLDTLLQQAEHKEVDEKTEEEEGGDPTTNEQSTPLPPAADKPKGSSNFLDMLMSKVNVRKLSSDARLLPASDGEGTPQKEEPPKQHDADFTDSSDEFLGFEETERLPGMLLTPLVPQSLRNQTNSAFVSESLDEYMRENLLETCSDCKEEEEEKAFQRTQPPPDCDGLVTATSAPPKMEMPLVPESLQRLRTVAERRQFLQKFSKNHKLAIINNEATVYRELQRKARQQKVKSAPLQLLQAPGAQMPFSRRGWQAASYVVTELNRYFYQAIQVDGGAECVKLPGVRGNNEERLKKPHSSRVPKSSRPRCSAACFDLGAWRDLKPIKTQTSKAKLHKNPFRPVFRPCPLSQKPFQKPRDDETAALLLAGGSMAVVRMPVVELEVFPAVAKPLHEVAKRYLQYILPHHDISREWAEFSVSTLLPAPRTMKEAEEAAAAANAAAGPGRRKSFTFAIPYLNDRNHILVRRVVDRSEQLDSSFEEREASSAVADFGFRARLDPEDAVQQECADMLSEMINSVAISCSENSFIKEDPDNIYAHQSRAPEEKPAAKAENLARDDGKTVAVLQPSTNKKQNRLLLELRRLNATIINAAAKPEKESKPCGKAFCKLGCLCPSLAEESPLRQHCGKSKCVVECSCKVPSHSRIMRLETDGRSITTEDAYLLRRKATARLARMEKEFTSTIVLTGNETLLINESQYDKKRRCTKAPKRYDDFTDADDEYPRTSPKKAGGGVETSSVSAPVADDRSSPNTCFSELATELREPIYVKDTILNELKHCSVALVRLEDTRNMAVWCLVHELYKCFCGGRALEGKPLAFERGEEQSATPASAQNGQLEYVAAAPKARYSFDKVETDLQDCGGAAARLSGDNVISLLNEDSTPAPSKDGGSEAEETRSTSGESDKSAGDTFSPTAFRVAMKRGRPHKVERRGRPLEQTILQEYMNAKLNWCRRVVAVPKKTYTRRNRKRVQQVLEFIEANENAGTRLTLNEHILRSVYYHKHELGKTIDASDKEKAAKGARLSVKDISQLKAPAGEKAEKQTPGAQRPPEASNDDDDDDDVQFVDENSAQSSLISSSSPASQVNPERRKRRSTILYDALLAKKAQPKHRKTSDDLKDIPRESSGKKRKTSEDPPATNTSPNAAAASPSADSDAADIVKVPKISSYCSLNSEAASSSASPGCLQDSGALPTCSGSAQRMQNAADVCAATEGSERQTAADLGLTEGAAASENFKDFYNTVIKNMNNLVSKKMQDIDMALKRESKVIPPPNEEILCIIKWSNFLDAFVEGFVFIWEVQLESQRFFAATITNLMPMVLGAVGVVSIGAIERGRLPLIGRMLMDRCRAESTRKLAIVMQGRTKYWLVKGFLHPDSSKACAKPTPQSHPLLTRKINVLCSLLVKQRVKEHQRKMELQQQATTTTTMTTTPPPPRVPADPQAPPDAVYLQNRPVVARRIMPKLASLSSTPPQTMSDNGQPAGPVPEPAATSSADPAQAQKAKASLKKSGHPAKRPKKQACVPPSSAAKSTLPSTSSQRKPSKMLRSLTSQAEFLKMKTNIQFRKVTTDDIEEIHQPEAHAEDHRWLVLDLFNDFSHIFVPDFSELVSLDRIHKVMAFSRQKQKIVKLQFFQNAPYDAFVTPSSSRNIYFGPLKLNMRPPLLILLQSVDGKMMLREVYHQEHNIPTLGRGSTTAFWLLQINGQMHFEIETLPTPEEAQSEAVAAPSQTGAADEEDSDEDCMIVEEPPKASGVEEVPDPAPARSDKFCSVVTNTSRQSNGIPLFPQPPPQAVSLDSPANSNPVAEPARMNFTIQTVESNQLQVTPDPANSLYQLSGPDQPVLQLPASAAPAPPAFVPFPLSVVITNITPAPQEAPYSSTIFVKAPENEQDRALTMIPQGIPPGIPRSTDITPMVSMEPPKFTTPVPEVNGVAHLGAPAEEAPSKPAASDSGGPNPTATMSLRCPRIADAKSTNIAIDAAISLLPKTDEVRQVCVQNPASTQPPALSYPGEPKGAMSAPGIQAAEVSKALSAQGSTMMLHNTTITKLSDSSGSGAAPPPSAEKKLPTRPKPPAPAPAPSAESAAKRRRVSSSEPMVFNVNFIDNADEPAASIVVKPPSALLAPPSSAPPSHSSTSPAVVSWPIAGSSLTATSANGTNAITTATTANSMSQPPPAKAYGSVSNRAVYRVVNHKPQKSSPMTVRVIKSGVVKAPNKVVLGEKIPVKRTGQAQKATLAVPKQVVPTSKADPNAMQQPPVSSASSRISLPSTSGPKQSTSPPWDPPKMVKVITRVVPARRSFPDGSAKTAQDNNSLVPKSPKATYIVPLPLPQQGNPSEPRSSVAKKPEPTVQYGYFSSGVPGLPKFVAKRIDDEYLIRVPNYQGIFKLKGLPSVNKYINKHVLKSNLSEDIRKKLPILWKFIPQDRLNPALRNKVKANGNMNNSVTSPRKGNPAQTDRPTVRQSPAGVVGPPSDTILIED